MTRLEDALAAVDAGADAVGMVLHAESARRISLPLARQIVAALPAFVTPVGLFVDAEPRILLELADELGLRHLQLHGNEPASIVSTLPGKVILKAIRIVRGEIEQALNPWRDVPGVGALLLETGGTKQAGGTGVENDWEAIRAHQSQSGFANLPPIVAAGGLRPENVEQVIRTLRPYAVDVSSGIESSPGVKSVEKMRDFVAAVRRADASA